MMTRARAIALYLPQFHPIPENDAWWGPGFTEWTNTAKGKPMFPGHYQPHVPADLGFYDLRLAESRQAQADLARRYGIEGFCYYHYWFAGRRILERPLAEVLRSGAPDLPFCLCWANETWSGIWHGRPNQILIEQTYPGQRDHEAHFQALLPAFVDRRYMRVDGKPLFLIFKPEKLPDAKRTLALWRTMAAEAGLEGLHICGMSSRAEWKPIPDGFDAKVVLPLLLTRPWVSRRHPLKWLRNRLPAWLGLPTVYRYDAFIDRNMPAAATDFEAYPCLMHAWDNTPRSGRNGVVLRDSTPEKFRRLLDAAIETLQDNPADHRLLFLKSWNEWAEGNHLEPDLRFGHSYLRAVAGALGAGQEPVASGDTQPAGAGDEMAEDPRRVRTLDHA